MSCLEISGEIPADFPFICTFSDEFLNFALTVFNFRKLSFSDHRAQRPGDKPVPLSPYFISIALLPKIGDLNMGFTFPALPHSGGRFPDWQRVGMRSLKSLPT